MRVLLVDDEVSIRRVCARVLRSVAEVTAVATAAEAFSVLEQRHFDVALVDLHLEAMSGEALLRALSQRWPGIRRVAFTASPAALKDASLALGGRPKPAIDGQLKTGQRGEAGR